MGGLLALSRGIDRVNLAVGRFISWLILAAVLISSGNAIIRKLFSISSNAWLEVQWYLFGAIVMLGAAATLIRNEHVRVDVIYGAISDRARLWVDLFGLIFFLLPFVAFSAYLCWPVFWQSFQNGETSMNAGGLIRWPVRGVLFLGFAALTAQGFSELIKRIAALRGLIHYETKYTKPLQ